MKKIDHIGIVVADLAQAIAWHRDVLGLTVEAPVDLIEHGVRVALARAQAEDTAIELIAPLGEGSVLARFLEKNPGGGMHHVCYAVEDIIVARDGLVATGVRFLNDGVPRAGLGDRLVLFANPKDTGGVLIELKETGEA